MADTRHTAPADRGETAQFPVHHGRWPVPAPSGLHTLPHVREAAAVAEAEAKPEHHAHGTKPPGTRRAAKDKDAD